MSIFSRKTEQRASLETFKIIIREADVKLKRFLTTIVLASLATLFLPAAHSQAFNQHVISYMYPATCCYKLNDKFPSGLVFNLPGYGLVKVLFDPPVPIGFAYRSGYSVAASNKNAGSFKWNAATAIEVHADSNYYPDFTYSVKFLFLSGPPNKAGLVLVVANIGFLDKTTTTATVSQPVYKGGELPMNNPFANTNPLSCATLVDGKVLPGAIGTILRSSYNWHNPSGCDDLNTGWALFRTTRPVQPIFGSNPLVWGLTVTFNQFHNDSMGFTLGYAPTPTM